MELLVARGLTKTIGISNFNLQQIEYLWESAKIKPACLQIKIQIYSQQRKILEWCKKRNIIVTGYSSLKTETR